MLELCFVTITLCKIGFVPGRAVVARKAFGISMAPLPQHMVCTEVHTSCTRH